MCVGELRFYWCGWVRACVETWKALDEWESGGMDVWMREMKIHEWRVWMSV